MNRILLTTIPAVLLAVLAAPDLASAQSDDGVVENVVVRNRKYVADGKFELNPGIGLALGSKLTSHTNFELGLAYNLFEQFGVELRGTFALNGLTSVGEDVRTNIYAEDPFVNTTAQRKDDFTDVWRLQYSGLVLPRWTPIYGKINLATELPIHFQGYLTAGAGMAGLKRESLVYCQNSTTSGDARNRESCQAGGYLESTRTGYAIAAGGGLRFFMADWAMLKLELFNISYPDKQLTEIQRRDAEGQAPGSEPTFATEAGAGFTSLLFFNIGTSFQF